MLSLRLSIYVSFLCFAQYAQIKKNQRVKTNGHKGIAFLLLYITMLHYYDPVFHLLYVIQSLCIETKSGAKKGGS